MNGGNMNPDTLGLLFNVLTIASALFVLWIAGRMVLRNLSFIQNKISSNRTIQVLIWIGLGEIFIIPLLDLAEYIQRITMLPSDRGVAYTLWGSVPALVYELSTVFTGLFIYSATLMIIWKPLFRRVPPIFESIQLNSFEKVYSLFVIAALVNHFIRIIILGVTWQQPPLEVEGLGNETAGFIVGWLTSLLLTAIIFYVTSKVVERQREKAGEISE